MDSVPSRVEDILLALINNSEYDGPIISRVEQILYSFLENSEYAAEPESRVEAILVALKAAGLYDDAVISRIEKILYSKLNGTEYTDEPESRVEELLLEWALSEEKELTGVVPLLFNADGTPLLDYLISGNTVQSTAPTPDNPIMPHGTGERTRNLFDEVYSDIRDTIRYRPIFVGDGTFTLSTTTPYDRSVANVFFLSGNVSSGASTLGNGAWKNHNVTTQSVDGYVTIAYRRYSGTTSPVDYQTMLNLGSTALHYEPYGIKIPISSNSTTTPVYLGEVQTTRKIGKYEFTGQENWGKGTYAFYSVMTGIAAYKPVLCTHYQYYEGTSSDAPIDSINTRSGSGMAVWIKNQNHDDTTIEQWKAYLAAQYTNGTPVTVWYVLATEETGIANEPLMKIGDYADSISMEQAGVEIPTNNGSNTLDVLTAVKPSEVYIKYKGR